MGLFFSLLKTRKRFIYTNLFICFYEQDNWIYFILIRIQKMYFNFGSIYKQRFDFKRDCIIVILCVIILREQKKKNGRKKRLKYYKKIRKLLKIFRRVMRANQDILEGQRHPLSPILKIFDIGSYGRSL